MKSWHGYLFSALILLVLLATSIDAERSRPSEDEMAPRAIPPVLYAHLPNWYEGYPVWVSAATAIMPDGQVNRDLVPENFAGALYRLLNDPALRVDGCVRVEEVWTDRVNPPDRSTLSKAVATADRILTGKVVEREYGFQAYTPGQLLRVQVDEVIKGEPGLSEYYAFIPVGRFTAGPYQICKSDSRYASSPSVGDRILLMPWAVADLAEPYLHLEEAEAFIVLPEGTKPRLPESLQESVAAPQDPGADELLNSVRRLARLPEEE